MKTVEFITLKSLGIWLFVIIGFGAYGYFGSDQLNGNPFSHHLATESALLLLVPGITIATCLASDYLIMARVRASRISRGTGVILLLLASLTGSIAARFLVPAARVLFPRDWDILGGEKEWGVMIMCGWSIVAAAIAFVLFSLLALYSRRERQTNF